MLVSSAVLVILILVVGILTAQAVAAFTGRALRITKSEFTFFSKKEP
jgi:hypothetical protein